MMNMWGSTLLCVIFASYTVYYSGSGVANALTVHIAPHTHDDVGWLKTVDQYYYGANNSIQVAQVQYILDTVITSLIANPNRKFIYVEIAFFWRWWREQTVERQGDVIQLVKEGRLEFINGGWCMNDEASTHYESIVDQMTLGHQFLCSTFGVTPKIGWHIDPFGHSSSQAALFANIGFEGFMFARIDYADRNQRWATKEMEYNWRGSQSLGPKSDIFTSVLYSGYGMPDGFSWESPRDEPIMDDPNLDGYNVQERADAFAAYVQQGAQAYKTDNFYIPWGTDFYYSNAELVFKNLDKLMNYIQANPDRYPFKVIYSTPSLYISAVRGSSAEWTTKTDDLFPYADSPHSYWTGYFTSRAAFKHFERVNNGLLQAITRFYVSARTDDDAVRAQIFTLQEAMGVGQHHDAVSGTEKQHVADDYAKRIANGASAAQQGFAKILNNVVNLNDPAVPLVFTFCPLVNESICDATQAKLPQGQFLPVVLYNSLAWDRVESVQFPVPASNLKVFDNTRKLINSQILPDLANPNAFLIAFQVSVGALSATTVFLGAGAGAEPVSTPVHGFQPTADVVFENDAVKAVFDGVTGGIKLLQNKKQSVSANVTQEYLYYLPSVGDAASSQASGAYIFRPAVEQTYSYATNTPKVTVITGSVVQEIRREFGPYLTQVVRLYNGTSHLEYVDRLGPIPMNGTTGKEVITRFSTSINSGANFYTDANGLEFQPRVRNFRPTWKLNVTEPTAGNYYPVNAAVYIKDTSSQLTFLTDRSRGASSLASGQVESMLNRACSKDDARGVGEVLNEQNNIISTQYATLDSPSSAASSLRPLAKRLAHPLIPIFGQPTDLKTYINSYKTDFTPLTNALPPNVQLLSLVPLDATHAILRLHHIYAVGEDANLSAAVTVDLKNLFEQISVNSVQEFTLTACQKIEFNDFSIVLNPMDIRTFVVELGPGIAKSVNSNVRIA